MIRNDLKKGQMVKTVIGFSLFMFFFTWGILWLGENTDKPIIDHLRQMEFSQ